MKHPNDFPEGFFRVDAPPPGFDPKTMNVVHTFRHSLGYTQRAIAERCGVTPALVQYWETGRALPSPVNTPALAAAIGVHPVSLLAWLGAYVPPEREERRRPTNMSARSPRKRKACAA
jgi:transcriptional regulator with XRE-family HTH domain